MFGPAATKTTAGPFSLIFGHLTFSNVQAWSLWQMHKQQFLKQHLKQKIHITLSRNLSATGNAIILQLLTIWAEAAIRRGGSENTQVSTLSIFTGI